MRGRDWALLLVLGAIWGASFFFGKIALGELPPFSIVLGRVALAALALNVVVLVTGRRLPASLAAWRAFCVLGALNNLVPFSLIVWGQTQIASGLAAILTASTPLFSALLAHRLTRDEPLISRQLGGVLLGLAGVTVMVGPEALGGRSLHVVAQAAVLGAAASYALAGIYAKRFADTPPLVTATAQVTATTVMMLPLVLVVDRPWRLPGPGIETWAALAALGLVCTSLAYAAYFRLIATAGATNAALVTLLVPVSALLLGTTILGERLHPHQLAGMTLIATGLVAIDGRAAAWIASARRRLSLGDQGCVPDDTI